MKIINSPAAMAAWSDKINRAGKTIALVPTMGSFHEGHLSLMRLAATKADYVVVSLFVNPIQFGPQEDLGRYPRDFERDASLAGKQGVDVLFAPDASAVYPEGFRTVVHVEGLTGILCGVGRPGHFDGVTTVVAKLFNMVRPFCAVFGEKDFQQLVVIRRLVADLNWDIRIYSHPIVREGDGLAMSSRNSYLSASERKSALVLYGSLKLARRRVLEEDVASARLVEEIREFLTADSRVSVEYVNLVNKDSLLPSRAVDSDTVLLLSVRIGSTRLIDNGKLIQGV